MSLTETFELQPVITLRLLPKGPLVVCRTPDEAVEQFRRWLSSGVQSEIRVEVFPDAIIERPREH